MSDILTFTVPGNPATKGSMRAVKHSVTGEAIMMHSAPKGLATWTASIRLAAASEYGPQHPVSGAVHVSACWHLARPKGHYRTGRNAGTLKPSAPKHPTAKRDDLDKLARALLDALTGIVYADDSQVVTLNASKRYTIGTGPQMIVSIDLSEMR
ncbi:MAG: RusA family crossover junction endodeoxyribonuclease [Phycisphaerae bacterium]|nr:RusA family crossover junction endodeoxyribonuclease [Phycisphaerae bacterium]